MLSISNIKVDNLVESIVASGLPLKPMTSVEFNHAINELNAEVNQVGLIPAITESKHYKRIMRLGSAQSGSGHDCFLKGITVTFFMEYPVYWSPQLQRYHFIDFVSSSSTMHTLDRMNFAEFPISKTAVEELNELRDKWKSETNPKLKYNIFETIMNRLPQGQTKYAYMTTNYLQLKSIINQRKFHKLEEWRYFCKIMLEKCPLLSELIDVSIDNVM